MANPLYEVRLTEDELEPLSHRPSVCTGAVLEFFGIVREEESDAAIEGIDYEAHHTMAEHQLGMVAAEAVEKFGIQFVALHHRVGFVRVGEPSLFLRVAGRHRTESFAAGQWIVDELKKRVPIWKHPRFKSGPRGSDKISPANRLPSPI